MTRAQSLQAGEVDMIAGDLTKIEYDLQQKGGYLPIDKMFLAIACLVPDSKNTASPLSNPKVRQAVDYAIDRDAIVNSLGYGFWVATPEFAIPGTPAYATDITPRAYNVDKAKQLLAEAGYPNGFKTQIMGNAVTTNKDVMVAVQNFLSKVGITADINMVDNAGYNNMILQGWNGFAAASKSINANVNVSINVNFSQSTQQNASLAKPDDFQALFTTSTTSPAYDPALVQKVTKYMYDNAMINCFYAVSRGYIMKPYLHDLYVNSQANAMAWGTATAWMSK
jgi:ABC-type transport system substrate-binding protein